MMQIMREPPPCPWINFPNLLEATSAPEGALAQAQAWLEFLIAISPADLLQYEREHPAPPEWQKFYNWAAQVHDLKRRDATTWGYALIRKMWQSTTLK
jgi:hypothetical protein